MLVYRPIIERCIVHNVEYIHETTWRLEQMGLVPIGYIRCLLEKERKPLMEGNDDRDKPGPPVALTLPPFLSPLFFLFFSDPPLFYLVDIAEKKEMGFSLYNCVR